MKKRVWATAAALAMGVSGMAVAANISNLNGQSCPDGFSGTWHFINNQVPGAPAGKLTATWSSGDTCMTGPAKILNSTQHFYCTASGTLTSAFTTLGGRLVLSDFTCSSVKECDPTKEKCDPPK